MPLVEIIRGGETSNACAATAYQLSLDMGKMPVCCRDGPGFVVNRILGAFMLEGGHLALEGNDLRAIDRACTDFGLQMGPFSLQDLVGLDVAAHVGPILHEGLGERFAVLPHFQKVMAQNKTLLGKKSGKGFYVYDSSPQQKQGALNSQLVDQLAKIVKKSDKWKPASHAEIIDRCVLIMVNEASHILAEKLVASAGELDLAMVMGTGFAPFYGGLCAYADYRGIANCVDRLKQLEKQCGMRFQPDQLLVDMASKGARFFPDRPDPKQLVMIDKKQLPRSKL